MTVVRCSFCRSVLTRELSSEPLPSLGDDDEPVPVGTWAVALDARTIRVWERGMPTGQTKVVETDPPLCVVVHPADRVNGALLEIDGRSAGCCGLDGCDGPNQACATCGAEVATARTDCWTAKEVRFLPGTTNVSNEAEHGAPPSG